MGPGLLRELRAEAERQRPGGGLGSRHGQPGDVLSRLAVSRQLREAVSGAVGVEVVPTYEAVYQYDGPGRLVAPHRDAAGYDLTFHMALVDSPSSVLEVFSGGGVLKRFGLAAGEGLVLRGREVLHGWTALSPDEQRTLIAIGFRVNGDDMPDNDDVKQGDEAEDEQVPDLDVTEESGEAVKGGVPTIIEG